MLTSHCTEVERTVPAETTNDTLSNSGYNFRGLKAGRKGEKSCFITVYSAERY